MAQSYPVLDTSTVALDEPDYEQMRQDRLDRTRASMKVDILSDWVYRTAVTEVYIHTVHSRFFAYIFERFPFSPKNMQV